MKHLPNPISAKQVGFGGCLPKNIKFGGREMKLEEINRENQFYDGTRGDEYEVALDSVEMSDGITHYEVYSAHEDGAGRNDIQDVKIFEHFDEAESYYDSL